MFHQILLWGKATKNTVIALEGKEH
jgi:hypothetical protein